jgi:hypothetical protein
MALLFPLKNGTYSALPYLFLWANMNISPFIADKLLATNKCTTTVVRKIFNTIGMCNISPVSNSKEYVLTM